MALDQELRAWLSQVMVVLLLVVSLIQTSLLMKWLLNLGDNLKKEDHLSERLAQMMQLEVPNLLLLNGHTQKKVKGEVQKPCVLTLKTTYTS